MNRLIFLVDGFNLYHSILDIGRNNRNLHVKWLDIHKLCTSYLHMFGNSATLECIYYFTAYAYHLNDSAVIQRHEDYVKCLESTGVIVELGRFKPKDVYCPLCNREFVKHEEKETDVAIGLKLFEIFNSDDCDTAVLITGDTDLVPAIKTANRLFPAKSICFAFPFNRKNDELRQIAPKSFRMHKENYMQCQFPDSVVLPDGTNIDKPPGW